MTKLCAMGASGNFFVSAARIIRTISVSIRDPTTLSLPSVADTPHPFSFDQCGSTWRAAWQQPVYLYLDSIPEFAKAVNFLGTEYGGPGTLLVEPFADMLLGLKLNKLPGAAVAARAALVRGQNYLDQDWEIWNFQQSHRSLHFHNFFGFLDK